MSRTSQEIFGLLRERAAVRAENEARNAAQQRAMREVLTCQYDLDLELTTMNGTDPNAPKSQNTGYPTANGSQNTGYPTAAGGGGGAIYGGMPIGTIVAGQGLTLNGNVLNGNYVISGGGGHSLNDKDKDKPTPTSPDLPDIVMEAFENERKVTMTLQPERSMSAYEALQLTMLMMAYCEFPDDFCPLAFVKKHNLERHFKFA